MSKFKKIGDQEKDLLNFSNDDFESPIVFKKFKPPNISSRTERPKNKKSKSSSKRQLTLDQVYKENFRYTDMNSEHLQLALALSRSTTEICNDNSMKEEFPLTSQKDGKKKTLLEFGFKINKPKMQVENIAVKREPQKTNKKSKFRFITPILMMRTEYERESMIQSKLSSIIGHNSIYPSYHENSTPVVSSEELERIRCLCCSIFGLNSKGDPFEEKDFIVPQLNIDRTRARTGVLLKNWKQIALRDLSPSHSKTEISNANGGADIVNSISTKDGNYPNKNQACKYNSQVFSNIKDLNMEVTQTKESIGRNKSPSNIELSAGYEYGSISPDLFDNNISLPNEHPQVKKNLHSIFSQEIITHKNNPFNAENLFFSSTYDDYAVNEECELNLKKKSFQEDNDSFEATKDECEENNYVECGQKICNDFSDENLIVNIKGNHCIISDTSKRKKNNTDNSLILNVHENTNQNTSCDSKELRQSDNSLPVSYEDSIVLTSDDEELSTLEMTHSKSSSKKCHGKPQIDLSQRSNKLSRILCQDIKSIQSNHEKNYQTNEYDIYEGDNGPPLPEGVHYDFSEGFELSSGIFDDKIYPRTDKKSSDEIILSSNDESDHLSDKLEIEKLHEKYLNNSSVNNSHINTLNSSGNHFLSMRSMLRSSNHLHSTEINYLNEPPDNFDDQSSNSMNILIRGNNHINNIILSSDDEICEAEISEKKNETSDQLELEEPSKKGSKTCTVDNSLSARSNSSENCKFYKEMSDPLIEMQLGNKDCSKDHETNIFSESTKNEIKISEEQFPNSSKISKQTFSEFLNDSVLNDIFEKNFSSIKNDNFESKDTRSYTNIETERKHVSFESDDEMKIFWNDESTSNLNENNKQRDVSKLSSPSKTLIGDVDVNGMKQSNIDGPFSPQSIQRHYSGMNFRNIDDISNANLVNTPNHKVRNSFNTPLRRCTSFHEKETPIKTSNFTRHKSESNITPNRKFIIKTDNITPMLDYNALCTPDIVKELDKFGLKPLKRKRGINLLKHIYETTHPILESHKSEVDELPGIKKRKSNKDEDLGVESQMKLKESESTKVWAGSILESDAIFERKRSSKISTCQVPLQIVWKIFLNENPNILRNILLYEPLQVEVIHNMLKELGFKFHIEDLKTFFDHKCITIRVAQGHQGKVG